MSRIFGAQRVRSTVTFLVPISNSDDPEEPGEYREETRDFDIREKLRPEAAKFLALLRQVSEGDNDHAEGVINKLLRHALAHPVGFATLEQVALSIPELAQLVPDGEPLTKETAALLRAALLDCIPPSEQVDILDAQGDIYGFKREEIRLGKKFELLITALFLAKSQFLAGKMMPGQPCASSSPEPAESTPPSPSEDGPTESLTDTGALLSENSGESASSSDS